MEYLSFIHVNYATHQRQLVEIGWLGQYFPYSCRICFPFLDGSSEFSLSCNTASVGIRNIAIVVCLHYILNAIKLCWCSNQMWAYSSIFLYHSASALLINYSVIHCCAGVKIIKMFDYCINISLAILQCLHQSIGTSLTIGSHHLL